MPHLLFEVRADTLDRQPGEVCFPGGHMESGETPAACALRETEEELSIPSAAIRPKPDENSRVGWFSSADAVAASSEPWFRERIYTKLNDKLSRF